MSERLKDFDIEAYHAQLEEVDANDRPDLVDKYSVRSVPYFILLDGDGEKIRSKSGMMTIEEVERFLDAP